MQLFLVRSLLQFFSRLQAATSLLSSCCSCVEINVKLPWHVLDLSSFVRLQPSWRHVQSRTHRWGGAGVVCQVPHDVVPASGVRPGATE
jgi:hypothetical protein